MDNSKINDLRVTSPQTSDLNKISYNRYRVLIASMYTSTRMRRNKQPLAGTAVNAFYYEHPVGVAAMYGRWEKLSYQYDGSNCTSLHFGAYETRLRIH